MRAVVYGGGSVTTVALPVWVRLTVVCFPHMAEATCTRCEGSAKLDGEKADAERELGRFVVRHQRCSPRRGFPHRAAEVSAAPSDEWMRAFERRGEGDGT